MKRPWPIVLAALSLCVAGAAAYARSLAVPFIFDDELAVVNNPSIRHLSELRHVFWAPPEAAGAAGRPLVNASLALNYAMGGLSPVGYHVANLLLHLLTALLLMGIVRRIVLVLCGGEEGRSLLAAWACALLWVVHPLTTEAVISAVQRDEGMASLFILLSLYAFIRGWLGLAWVASILAALSKEIAVVIPLLLLGYDRTLLAGSFRAALRARGRFYASLLVSWALVAALLLGTRHRGDSVGFGLGLSSWDYLLTQAWALCHYARLVVWPHPLVVDYGSPVIRSLSAALVPGAAVLACLGLSLWLFSSGRPGRRTAGWALLAAFAILAPSSSVVPLVTQTVAEHRMYLPLAAVLSVLGVALLLPLQALRARQGAAAVVLVLAVAESTATLARSADYADALTLWKVTDQQAPGNPRVLLNLGTLYSRSGDLPNAIRSYERSIGADPKAADTHYNLAAVFEQSGQLDQAETEYRASIALDGTMPNAHFAFGLLLARQQRYPEALSQLETAQTLEPGSAAARLRRAGVEAGFANSLCSRGRMAEALPHFERAVSLKPDFAQALNNWGNALAYLNRHAEAVQRLKQAVAADPTYVDSQYNLGLELAETGKLAEARDHLEAALRLRPGDPQIAEDLKRVQAQAP